MIELIKEIIERFGPRIAGSEAEKRAQLFISKRCKVFTDDVQIMSFEAYLDARFGKLKYFVILYLIALMLYWVSPVLALLVSVINTVFLVVDFLMYRSILKKFPGKKQTSWNVEATLEPQEEVKSTLIISGHMDSTREFTWWYKLGYWGKRLTIYAGILILLQTVFYLAVLLFPFDGQTTWFLMLILSPILVVYWSMQGKEGVPGAHDNLSGISIAFNVFKDLHASEEKGKSQLKNTRIRFISFGSEERGLCGATAYVDEFYDKIKSENTWMLNFDSIRQVDKLAVVTSEAAGTKHHPKLVKGLKNSFEALQIPCQYTSVFIGGMDSTPFARKGIPTVSMIGIDTKDPYYHTRNDTVENIEPDVLENTYKGVMHFIQKWDNEN